MKILFQCEECGAMIEIDAKDPAAARGKLALWDHCPVGKHPVLLSMRESCTIIEVDGHGVFQSIDNKEKKD